MDKNINNKFKLTISTIFRSSCRDRSVSDTTKIPPKRPPTHPFPASIHKPKIKPDPARQKLSESYSLFYSAHSAPLLEKKSIEKTRKKNSRRRRRRGKINNVRTELKHESYRVSSEVELDDDDDDALLLGSGRRPRRDMEKIDRRRQHRHQMEQADDSYAVVKCSKDPYMDFRTSMVEMIVEKKMRRAEDLERLLQCFLKLNSYRHHPVIIEAFMDIWDALFLY